MILINVSRSGHLPQFNIHRDSRLDGEDDSFVTARSWIDKDPSAAIAVPESSSSMLPPRLIETSQDLSSDNALQLRLVTTSEPSRPVYATLSHRWGECLTLKTERSNPLEPTHSIPLSKLPQTFRDAVVATNRLGYRYLRIDALCIVQDDETEWANESIKMGAIYRGAAVTIAAHAASDTDSGFLNTLIYPWKVRLRPIKISTLPAESLSDPGEINYPLLPKQPRLSSHHKPPLQTRMGSPGENSLPQTPALQQRAHPPGDLQSNMGR